MDRRSFLKAGAAAAATAGLPAPSMAQSARSRTLVFAPTAGGLTILDPLVRFDNTTTFHGYCVFDTLFCTDSQLRPRPQMAEGVSVSDDGLIWTIKLRPGLKFHDGAPVLARDVVSSIKRWGKRDSFGISMLGASDAVETVDDATLRIRMKQRYPVLDALAHSSASPMMVMPERLAETDAAKPVSEMIGSGPYRFIASEFVPGAKSVYERNQNYIPRAEPAEAMSGGKVAHFERIEIKPFGDPTTASSALMTGEIDWWEVVASDLIPILRKEPSVQMLVGDPGGFTGYLRFNHLHAPFNNKRLRQIVMEAVDQNDFNQAVAGSDPNAQKTCFSFFHCSVPGVQQVAEKSMSGKKDWARLQEEVKKSGYAGEKIVVVSPVDIAFVAPFGPIAIDILKKLGLNAELQSVDFQTQLARRNNKDAVDKGGWSIFLSSAPASAFLNPVVAVTLRGLGERGFPGWYESKAAEDLVVQWAAAPDDQARHQVLQKLQLHLLDEVPLIPLGNFIPPTGLRKDITGHLPGPIAVPWNVRRV